MITFPDDFIRVEGRAYSCAQLGLSWPPPSTLRLVLGPDKVGVAIDQAFGAAYRRVSVSSITDEQREGMTHVARGAEYERT